MSSHAHACALGRRAMRLHVQVEPARVVKRSSHAPARALGIQATRLHVKAHAPIVFSNDDAAVSRFFVVFSLVLALIRLSFVPMASSLSLLPNYKLRSDLPCCFLAASDQI